MARETLKSYYGSITPNGTASFSAFYGLAVWNPQREEDYIPCADGALITAWYYNDKYDTFHRNRVHYTGNGRGYIIKGELRIYLDQIMRRW